MNPVSFLGCRAPYYLPNKTKVIPISKDPSPKEVSCAIAAVNDDSKEPKKGSSGKVYDLGRNSVVKIYNDSSSAHAEITELDSMYDKGISADGIQKAQYAVITNNEKHYLVSEKISGKPAGDIKFNPQNLSVLMDAFFELDKPRRDEDGNYGIYFHNDLHRENVIVDENSAGIIDFQSFSFKKLESAKWGFDNAPCYPVAYDTPGYTSNLREFEIEVLYKYIDSIPDIDEYEEFLCEYLKLKSQYHKKMSEYLEREYAASSDEVIRELAIKHKAHAQMLANPTDEVMEAEYLKMRINKFLGSDEIIHVAHQLMTDMYLKSHDNKEKIYWSDCLDLIDKILT